MLVPEKTYKNRQNYRASNDPPGIGICVNVPTPAKIEEKVHSVIKTLVCFQRDLVCIALRVGPYFLFYNMNFLFPPIWYNIFGKAENCPPALDKKYILLLKQDVFPASKLSKTLQGRKEQSFTDQVQVFQTSQDEYILESHLPPLEILK